MPGISKPRLAEGCCSHFIGLIGFNALPYMVIN